MGTISFECDGKTEKLTAGLLVFTPAPNRGDALEFTNQQPNPAALFGAIMSKDQKFCSMIQADYITDFTCKLKGDEATGIVKFEAKGVYVGWANYHATRVDGKWEIDLLEIPKFFRSEKRQNGTWRLTTIDPPAPVADKQLEGDLKILRGVWMLAPDSRPLVNGMLVSPLLTITGNTLQMAAAPGDRDSGFPKISASFVLQNLDKHKVITLYKMKREDRDEQGEFPVAYTLDGNTLVIAAKRGAILPPGTWVRMKTKNAPKEDLKLEPIEGVPRIEIPDIPGIPESGR